MSMNLQSKKVRNSLGYYRIKTYDTNEILKLIEDFHGDKELVSNLEVETFNDKGEVVYRKRLEYKGGQFKVGSQRLETFLRKGLKCVSCGVEGKFFSLDTANLGIAPHLNLIGVRENGEEVLMTSDHIYPKCLGGSNSMDNRQTMCDECNVAKGGSY